MLAVRDPELTLNRGDIEMDLALEGVAEALRRARTKASMTQVDVAAATGLTQQAVSRLESGGADARLSTIYRYCAAVGLTSLPFDYSRGAPNRAA